MRSILSLTISLAVATAACLPAADPEPKPLEIGQAAPAFRLPGVDGKTHTLDDFKDAKALVIVFTCNHCPTAQLYEERLKTLAGSLKDKGGALVAISPNDPQAVRLDELGYTDLGDSFEDMKVRAKDRDFNFPYLYDGETQEVSRAYGPAATPHAYVFDADRKLRYTGRIDDSEKGDAIKAQELRDAVDAVLAGKPVPKEKTRTFGCSIKWSSKRPAADAKAKEPDMKLELVDLPGLKKLKANQAEKPSDGKVRLLNVWATWCGPCVKEFPELVTMQRMYGHRAFELVTLSLDAPGHKEKVLEFLKKQGAAGTHYQWESDNKDPVLDNLVAEWSGAIPLTLLIAPGGKLLLRKEGEIDPLEVRRAIVKAIPDDR